MLMKITCQRSDLALIERALKMLCERNALTVSMMPETPENGETRVLLDEQSEDAAFLAQRLTEYLSDPTSQGDQSHVIAFASTVDAHSAGIGGGP